MKNEDRQSNRRVLSLDGMTTTFQLLSRLPTGYKKEIIVTAAVDALENCTKRGELTGDAKRFLLRMLE